MEGAEARWLLSPGGEDGALMTVMRLMGDSGFGWRGGGLMVVSLFFRVGFHGFISTNCFAQKSVGFNFHTM